MGHMGRIGLTVQIYMSHMSYSSHTSLYLQGNIFFPFHNTNTYIIINTYLRGIWKIF